MARLNDVAAASNEEAPPQGLTRRAALRDAAKLVVGATAAGQVMAATGANTAIAKTVRDAAAMVNKPGYGPLVQHTGEMSLPAGFTVVSFGEAYSKMDDGHLVPPCHDGSAVFDMGNGVVRMIRNQEGYGQGKARGGRYRAYDRVARGGVTSTVFDSRSGAVLATHLVLNGTDNNCNGGVTPWGSWLSCEESTVGPNQGYERRHGYVFEVPGAAKDVVEPVPIKAMGRFEHEAAIVDPRSGIVYMTEDCGEPGDGFYRYLPNDTRRLHKGGKLQMLAVEGRLRYDTTSGQKVGRKLRCEWVTIDDPDPEHADLHPDAVFQQGRAKGAAQFISLEGAKWKRGSAYFVASEGGDRELGQIWKYTPRGLKQGVLELLYESKSDTTLEEPDAIAISPRGGVVLCEDGDGGEVGGSNFIRVLTPAGKVETIARNDTPMDLEQWEEEKPGTYGRSEWSGAVYSPDGKWLFVHIQYPGKSFAITGPWERGWL
jgi:secreted PhoX family phosphatase